MPLIKRTALPLVTFDPAEHNVSPTDYVYQMRFTGEIFTDYEYALPRSLLCMPPRCLHSELTFAPVVNTWRA